MPPDAEVMVVQRSLRRYREPFYENLREILEARNIRLHLLHSTDPSREKRGDPGRLPWAATVPARELTLAGTQLTWQPCLRRSRGVDLVVVEQASVLLVNYALLASQRLGGPRVAFWGHGLNFNTNARSSAGEMLKRFVSRQPHWWFPYTDEGKKIVQNMGFPGHRITVVRNSTDTRRLSAQVDSVTTEDLARLRSQLALQGANVGLFVGALSPYKQFDYLFQAADHIREKIDDFELVVVGGGPMAQRVAQQARTRPWVRLVPHRFGQDLAVLLQLAKAILVPGWAGLVVVDSFAAGRPLVASASFPHPPELAYIRHGENGLLVQDDGNPEIYAQAVSNLLMDEPYRSALAQGALEERNNYCVEEMAARFAAGIEQALA